MMLLENRNYDAAGTTPTQLYEAVRTVPLLCQSVSTLTCIRWCDTKGDTILTGGEHYPTGNRLLQKHTALPTQLWVIHNVNGRRRDTTDVN